MVNITEMMENTAEMILVLKLSFSVFEKLLSKQMASIGVEMNVSICTERNPHMTVLCEDIPK
jgi:hypothetical protein